MAHDFDRLLCETIAEAKAIKIPVSGAIKPQVVVNKRAKKRYGCCIKKGFVFTIELSFLLLEANERFVRQTLAHEVLHTCFGCRNHQARWKEYARRMNEAYGYDIKRTEKAESLGIEIPENPQTPKYLITCERCGAVTERFRETKLTKYPSRYRCKCGGKLSVTKKR